MSKVTIRVLVQEVNKTFAVVNQYRDIHESITTQSIFEKVFGKKSKKLLAQYAELDKQKKIVQERYEYQKTLELRKPDVAQYQAWYDAAKSYFDAVIELAVINEGMKKLFEYSLFEVAQNVDEFKEFNARMQEKIMEMNEKINIYNQLSDDVF